MNAAEAAREVALDLGCIGTPEQDRIATAFEKFAELLDRDSRPCSYCDGTGIVPGSEGQVWIKGRGWVEAPK